MNRFAQLITDLNDIKRSLKSKGLDKEADKIAWIEGEVTDYALDDERRRDLGIVQEGDMIHVLSDLLFHFNPNRPSQK